MQRRTILLVEMSNNNNNNNAHLHYDGFQLINQLSSSFLKCKM